MSNIINKINDMQMRNDLTQFNPGDTICINFNIIDNKYKNRNQNFEGVVISIKNNGLNTTCTVRKISYGEGLDKTFFLHSPTINWIKIKKFGLIRKAKLYYIRKLKGKAARIKERIISKRRDDRVA